MKQVDKMLTIVEAYIFILFYFYVCLIISVMKTLTQVCTKGLFNSYIYCHKSVTTLCTRILLIKIKQKPQFIVA